MCFKVIEKHSEPLNNVCGFQKVNNNVDWDFQDGNLLILLDSRMESVVSEINQLVQKIPKCPRTKLQDHTSQEKKTRRKTITGNAQTLRQKYLEKCVVFEDSSFGDPLIKMGSPW